MTNRRKLWACTDGIGGYDIGEGSITIASIPNLRIAEAREAQEYEEQHGRVFDPRATAKLFKLAPALEQCLRDLVALREAVEYQAYVDMEPFSVAADLLSHLDAETQP